LFQRAAQREPTPRAIGQLGVCEQALGLWIGAEAHIAEALKHPQDIWVQKNEASLRSALAFVQQRLGSVEVWGSPAGARVSIGGEIVATLPMIHPVRAVAGQRTITIEASGFLPENITVAVRAGDSVREHVVLRSLSGSSTPLTVPALAGAPLRADNAPVASVDSQGEVSPPEETKIYRKWWFWAAVGVVAIAGGATVYLVSNRTNGECMAQQGGVCTNF